MSTKMSKFGTKLEDYDESRNKLNLYYTCSSPSETCLGRPIELASCRWLWPQFDNFSCISCWFFELISWWELEGACGKTTLAFVSTHFNTARTCGIHNDNCDQFLISCHDLNGDTYILLLVEMLSSSDRDDCVLDTDASTSSGKKMQTARKSTTAPQHRPVSDVIRIKLIEVYDDEEDGEDDDSIDAGRACLETTDNICGTSGLSSTLITGTVSQSAPCTTKVFRNPVFRRNMLLKEQLNVRANCPDFGIGLGRGKGDIQRMARRLKRQSELKSQDENFELARRVRSRRIERKSITTAPFVRQLRLIIENLQRDRGLDSLRFQAAAVLALKEASEHLLLGLFEKCSLFVTHSKRVTLMTKDLNVARKFVI